MPQTLEIPDRAQARVAEVEIPVKTGKGEDQKGGMIKVELPKDIESAISLLGKEEVHKRFIGAYVVFLQGKERNRLNRTDGSRRNRASYLDSVGL